MKSKGGRPPVGPTIHVKLPPDLLAHLDRLARSWGVSRSEAVRQLVAMSRASG